LTIGTAGGAAPTTVRLAAGLVITACLFFAGANALAKAVQLEPGGPPVAAVQIVFCRFLFGSLTLVPWIVPARRRAFTTAVPKLHVLRVGCAFAGLVCLFAALEQLPLAEATALAWASPIFAMLFAALFLAERIDRCGWLAAALGFLGVLVMLRPGTTALAPAGLLALAAAVFVGAEVAAIKALAGRDPPLTVLAIANLAGLALSTVVALPFLTRPTLLQGLYLAGVGVVMVIGQLLFLRGLSMAPAGALAPFYYATLLHAFLIGWLAFGEVPGWATLLGAGLIVAAGLLVALRR
jgi:drug/metabolite transporter (DMT)-like permease